MTAAVSNRLTSELVPHVRKIGDLSHLDLAIIGARCGGCIAKIERGMNEIPGMRQARMNLSTARLHVAWDGDPSQANLISSRLEQLGFKTGPIKTEDAIEAQQKSESRRLLLCMAVAAFGLMNVMILSIAVWAGGADMTEAERNLFHMISAAIALPVIAFSGRPFFTSAWRALRAKQGNMDVPISLAIILAVGLSVTETILGNEHAFFDAALMLIFLLLIGRFLDAQLRARTGRAAQDLAAMKQINARRINETGQITDIPSDAVRVGDQLHIAVGSHIPVDGKIVVGESMIDVAIVTGEPVPQYVTVGEAVYSGCLNLQNPITIEVTRAADDSFLSEITKLVEAGQQTQTKYVQLADRAARAYVPIVHTLALLTFIGWLLVGGTPRTAIINAIAVLIITCPCALGLAVPAVQVVAVGKLFGAGIVVKTGHALERLSEITDVIFDKTGTLTQTLNTGFVESVDPKELNPFVSLAQQSTHPATSHLRRLKSRYVAKDVTETPGEGITGYVSGIETRLGRKAFVTRNKEDESASGLWAQVEAGPLLELTANETLRLESKQTLSALRRFGLRFSLVSGDTQARVKAISSDLGIDDFQAEVTPDGKSDIVMARQAAGAKILMVGDGINDAPALSHAHASAALASATSISRATSDIVLRNDSLSGLPYAVKMARAARRAVLQNFGFAAIYNFLAVPLAVAGMVTPLIAAVAMSLSSIIVTLNALRLNWVKSEEVV